jgi:lysophospholipase L1-like esterase
MASFRFVALAAAVCIAAGSFAVAETVVGPATPATAPATAKAPAQAADKPAVKMRGNHEDDTFMKRHAEYVALARKGNIDLYFVGDSITDWWSKYGKETWSKEFAGWNPGNFGISADRTQHVLWRLKNGELDGVKPKVFVMMIGTNNLGANTNEQIVAGNAAIIKELRETNPQAKVLLLGIFPRASKTSDVPNSRIPEINKELAKLADGKEIQFLDLGPKFLDEQGNLPKSVMPDGLHPNEKGYEIWAEAIKPKLTELLGAPAKAGS